MLAVNRNPFNIIKTEETVEAICWVAWGNS